MHVTGYLVSHDLSFCPDFQLSAALREVRRPDLVMMTWRPPGACHLPAQSDSLGTTYRGLSVPDRDIVGKTYRHLTS